MKKRFIALTVSLSLPFATSAAEMWDRETVYNAGDLVQHGGETFVSSHWNRGNEPEVNDISWDGWIHIDSTSIVSYEHQLAYKGGSIVNFEGDVYLAKWWVQGEYPSESGTWRLLKNFNLDPTDPTDPVKPPKPIDPKSPEAIAGIDSDNDGLRDSYKDGVLAQYQEPEMINLALNLGLEYADVNEFYFDDSLVLSKDDAVKKLNDILALEVCAEHLQETGQINKTPLVLYADDLYRSLAYRIGKERIFEQTGNDFRAIAKPAQVCPEALTQEAK